MKTIAEKLKQLRVDSGMSQEKLAEKLMVSRQAVSKWENGEALPDMENMIALARLYSTSLDELAGIVVDKEDSYGATQSTHEEHTESNAEEDGSAVNINITKEGDSIRINLDGININVNDDDHEDLGDFDDLDIFGDDDGDDDEDNEDDDEDDDVHINIGGNIKIDNNGINVNDGKIKIDTNGININDGKVRIDSSGVIIDDDEKKKSGFIKFLYAFPYPLVVTIGFFLLGALANAWWIAWILFCTVPVYYSLVTCIHKRKFTPFAYSVFSTCIYLYIGMAHKMWHPGWIIFLTIPVYHAIAIALDKFIKNHKK